MGDPPLQDLYKKTSSLRVGQMENPQRVATTLPVLMEVLLLLHYVFLEESPLAPSFLATD